MADLSDAASARTRTGTNVDALIDEGLSTPIEGWDFTRFGERLRSESTPWDYSERAVALAADADAMLDLGTGGGEWLSRLLDRHRPRLVTATEGWPPNVPVAARTLAPYSVTVVWHDGAPDNVDQTGYDDESGALPFRTNAFDLVSNRHESYLASEVHRVLKPGGVYVTQQIGEGWADELFEVLELDPPPASGWTYSLAAEQIEAAGLVIDEGESGDGYAIYADVAPLVWYLRISDWIVPDFEPAAERALWQRIQGRIDRDGPLRLRVPHFWLRTHRPG